jgi:hypothetical protein
MLQAGQAQRAQSTDPADLAMLTAWPDRSGSLDNARLQQMLPELSRALKKASKSVDGIEGIAFSIGRDSGWTGSPERFIWGAPAVARPFDPNQVEVPPEIGIFRQAREKFLQDAHNEYDARALAARQAYSALVDEKVEQFIAWAGKAPVRPSPCTHFEDLAVRLYGQNRARNLVITDGLFDCTPKVQGKIQRNGFKGKIIVLMVPSLNDNPRLSEETKFRMREKDILGLFPSAIILRPYEIEKLPALLEEKSPAETVPRGETIAVREVANADKLRVNVSASAVFSTPAHPSGSLRIQMENDLRSTIKTKQLENVRLSWGPNAGECFTNQDLQEMISTKRLAKIAETLKHDRSFLKILIAAEAFSAAERSGIGDSVRTAFHKTWTERGIVDANGQTVAGVQAELLIAGTIVNEFQNMAQEFSTEELESLLMHAKH